MIRADHLQNIYLASLKLRLPARDERGTRLSQQNLDRPAFGKTGPRVRPFSFLQRRRAAHRATGCAIRSRPRRRGGQLPCAGAGTDHARGISPARPALRRRFHPPRGRAPGAGIQGGRRDSLPVPFREGLVRAGEGCEPERVLVVPYGIRPAPGSFRRPSRPGLFSAFFMSASSARARACAICSRLSPSSAASAQGTGDRGPGSQPTGLEGVTTSRRHPFHRRAQGRGPGAGLPDGQRLRPADGRGGLALVLGEALSFGLPVIATVNSGGGDLFTRWRGRISRPHPRRRTRSPQKCSGWPTIPALRERMSPPRVARPHPARLGGNRQPTGSANPAGMARAIRSSTL